jgi:hypothetical protein
MVLSSLASNYYNSFSSCNSYFIHVQRQVSTIQHTAAAQTSSLRSRHRRRHRSYGNVRRCCRRRRCCHHYNLTAVVSLVFCGFPFKSFLLLLVLLLPLTLTEIVVVVSVEGIMTQQQKNSRLVFGKDDALFGAIEEIQQQQQSQQDSKQDSIRQFGHILDAGTGLHSIRWIATLVGTNNDTGEGTGACTTATATTPLVTKFTAITADTTMQRNVQDEVDALGICRKGQVVVGNWFPSTGPGPTAAIVGTATTQTHGSTSSLDLWLDEDGYDTILADYLIGAMDGFSPYQQDQMIPLLSRYLKPGGRLYIVGLQPLPDKVDASTHPNPADAAAANIICRVRQVRDACILLAGHRCYREYPLEWIERQINNESSLELIEPSKQFPILYRYATIQKQIQVARSKLKLFDSSFSSELALEMSKTLDQLDAQAKKACDEIPGNKIKLGFDYVVAAEKK